MAHTTEPIACAHETWNAGHITLDGVTRETVWCTACGVEMLDECNYCQEPIGEGQIVRKHQRGNLVHDGCLFDRWHELRRVASITDNSWHVREDYAQKADVLFDYFGEFDVAGRV